MLASLFKLSCVLDEATLAPHLASIIDLCSDLYVCMLEIIAMHLTRTCKKPSRAQTACEIWLPYMYVQLFSLLLEQKSGLLY